MGDLKEWVGGADDRENAYLQEGMVVVSCRHNLLKTELKELRLDLHQTIGEVKEKLYRHCGTSPEWMALVLKSGGRVLCELKDDKKKLGFYGVKTGMEVKIIDQNPHSLAKNGGLEDVSLVKKYVMTDDDYDKRENTLRNFKKKKLKEDPTFRFFPKKNEDGSTKTNEIFPGTAEDVKGIEIGQRCEVQPGGRRGRVGFVGEVQFAVGYWVGVVLDEPLGRNDGSVKGKRYMKDCEKGYGLFAHPKKVLVGDYPEIDELDMSSSDDEEL